MAQLKLIAGGSSIALGAVSIAAQIAQDANNKIINDLCNKRNQKMNNYMLKKNDIKHELNPLQAEAKQNEQSIRNISNEIQQEEKAMTTFHNVKNDETMQFIVGLGNTGHGKSTTLNRLCGDTSKYGDKGPFEASDSDQSVTQVPVHQICMINNVKSVVVDTPGYKDTENRDDWHFNDLERYLYGCGGVDAFLLVVNGTLQRFDGNIKLMLKEYCSYFGSGFWKHLIVILTRIEGIEKEKFMDKNRGKTLQKNLKNEFGLADGFTIPIVTVGYGDDYKQFCKTVINEVVKISNRHSKLSCTRIESPIKKLRTQKQQLKTRKLQLNSTIATKELQITDLNGKIELMQQRMDNPEKYPLLSNYGAKI